MSEPTMHFLTPSYRPMGGVVKIMDYVVHARRFGYAVSVWCPQPFAPDLEIFEQSAFRALLDDDSVIFHSRPGVRLGDEDLLFVSLPTNFNMASRKLRDGMSPERVIHIIQNVRHVNPSWLGGQGARVLTRPAARISINQIVAETIEPWLDPRGLHRVINLGHDVGFFAKTRSGAFGDPVRVAYTTWKSEVGTRVQRAMADDRGFEFRAITETATWPELRELYHWADVFLSTPSAEEGMYLPGLEAMAAGCLVVTPDATGNMAYCRPGENCLLVGFESVTEYAAALRRLAAAPAAEIDAMRASGYAATRGFDLMAERLGFRAFLDELWDRIRERELAA